MRELNENLNFFYIIFFLEALGGAVQGKRVRQGPTGSAAAPAGAAMRRGNTSSLAAGLVGVSESN